MNAEKVEVRIWGQDIVSLVTMVGSRVNGETQELIPAQVGLLLFCVELDTHGL